MGSVYRAGAAFFMSPYEPLGSVSSQALTRLICFHFSAPTWRMAAIPDEGGSVVITTSTRFNMPHGVDFPAVVLGDGENETQVLEFAWLMLTSIPLWCSYRAWMKCEWKCSLGIISHARLAAWLLPPQLITLVVPDHAWDRKTVTRVPDLPK